MILYFAPDQDCATPLLNAVNSAKTSILIADYSFSFPALTEALIAKHKAGVVVKMVLDRSQSSGKSEVSQIALLKQAGVDYVIGTSDQHQIMHLKVAVIDNSVTIFGSYNFTNAAARENNVLAVDDSPSDSQLFTNAINKAYAWITANEPQSAIMMSLKENSMAVFKLSAPSQQQVVKSVERVVAVFLVAAFGAWQIVPDKFSKAAGLAAVLAGFTAVYQLFVSTVTTL